MQEIIDWLFRIVAVLGLLFFAIELFIDLLKRAIKHIKQRNKMYYVSKRLEVAGAHCLELDYESPCQRLHGHNWIITVYCKARELNPNGMVVDFKRIKEIVHGKMDHQFLNEIFPFNPTAENIARYIVESIPECYKAQVQESEGNVAIYEED